jgi:hypothetical protein
VSYILGSLAGSNNAALDALVAQFSAQLLPLAKTAIAQNFTRYQAYNLFRFNISDMKSTSDRRHKNLMKRDSKGDIKAATIPFKAYYRVCVPVAAVINLTNKPKKAQISAVAFDVWKLIWAQITPELPSDVKADAESEPAKDNTMLYVAGAAAVALVAFGVARRKGG